MDFILSNHSKNELLYGLQLFYDAGKYTAISTNRIQIMAMARKCFAAYKKNHKEHLRLIAVPM